jgi:hypothetical protein
MPSRCLFVPRLLPRVRRLGPFGNGAMAKSGVAALIAILVAAVFFMIGSMDRFSAAEVPTSGTVAMWLGIIFSVIVGCGLMARSCSTQAAAVTTAETKAPLKRGFPA